MLRSPPPPLALIDDPRSPSGVTRDIKIREMVIESRNSGRSETHSSRFAYRSSITNLFVALLISVSEYKKGGETYISRNGQFCRIGQSFSETATWAGTSEGAQDGFHQFCDSLVNDIYLLRQNACTLYSHGFSIYDIMSTYVRTRTRKFRRCRRSVLSRRKSAGLRNVASSRFSPRLEDNSILIPHRVPRVRTVCMLSLSLCIYLYAVINVMSLLSHSRWHIPIGARLGRECMIINDIAPHARRNRL